MLRPDVRRRFETLVAAAWIDGRLADEERALLQRKATEYDIPIRLFDELIQRGERQELAIALPPDRERRLGMLDDLVDLVCSDGRLDRAENRLLLRFATHADVDPQTLGKRVQERLVRIRRRPVPEPLPVLEIAEPPPPVPVQKPSGLSRSIAETVPHRTVEASPARMAEDPVSPPPGESLLGKIPRGPVVLGGPVSSGSGLPPVTRGLVRSVIVVNGIEAGLRYLTEQCGMEESAARAGVAELMAADPGMVPGSAKIEIRQR